MVPKQLKFSSRDVCEFLGVEVDVRELTPTPLSLEIEPGMNIFYGLNGVGKSRILQSIINGRFKFKAPLDQDSPNTWSLFWPDFDFNLDGKPFVEHILGETDDRSDEASGPFKIREADRQTFDYRARNEELLNVLQDDSWRELAVGTGFAYDEHDFSGKWLLYLSYWLAGAPKNDNRWLVAEALAEVLTQGRITSEISGQGSHSRSMNTYSIRVSPDDSPAFIEFLNTYARLLIQEAEQAETSLRQFLEEHQDDQQFVGLTPWSISSKEDLHILLDDLVLNNRWLKVPAKSAILDVAWSMWLGRTSEQPVIEYPGEVPVFQVELEDFQFPFTVVDVDRWQPRSLEDEILQEVTNGRHHLSPDYRVPIFDENFDLTEDARQVATRFEAEANQQLQELLLDGPMLRIQVLRPDEVSSTERLIWQAEDKSGAWVSISELSDTQQRLIKFALFVRPRLGVSGLPVIVLDEPERGLHRLAEAHLRQGLKAICDRRPELVVIVASHSPTFLRPDISKVHHVIRNSEGALEVASLPGTSLGDIAALGIPPAELLLLYRVIVLVEGVHDQWVLSKLFGDELRDLGAYIAPIRGGENQKLVAAADANIIFNFTEANLVVMLDAIDQKRVQRVWEQALQAKAEGKSIHEIRNILEKIAPANENKNKHELHPKSEYRWLVEFCQAAIEKGRESRVTLAMVGEPDIQYYLSTKQFLIDSASGLEPPTWRELKKDHERALNNGASGNFKNWLQETNQASFEEERWDSAIDDLQDIPEDLLEVLEQIRTASQRSN